MTATATVEPTLQPTVVHLIHGTWPYGPLRTQRPPDTPEHAYWFDRLSGFAEAIFRGAGGQVSFEPFAWSGRQSMEARAEAGEAFLDHLLASVERHGDARHVIVAHSHGGTVAAQALMDAALALGEAASPGPQHAAGAELRASLAKVPALVCLASPFAYISPGTAHARSAWVALAVLLANLVWLPLLHWQAALLPHVPSLALLAAYLLILAPFGYALARAFVHEQHAYGPTTAVKAALLPIPDTTRVFLIRATNDEASLLIGLAQSLGWLLRWAHLPITDTQAGKGARGMVPLALVALGAWLLPGWAGWAELSLLQRVALALTIVPGLLGGLFVLGCVLFGAALGALRPRLWLMGEPVMDAAPPGVAASVKCYSEVYLPRPTAALRHGIYDDPRVARDVAQIVRDVALGKTPELRREPMIRVEGREKELLFGRRR